MVLEVEPKQSRNVLIFELFQGQTKVTLMILYLKHQKHSICSDYEANFLHA
jgi:hypothetical protein